MSCTWNWELILSGRHAIYTEIMLPMVLAAQCHFTLNTHHFTMDIHPEKTNKQNPGDQRSTGSVRMILWWWFSSVFWNQSQNEGFAARWGEMKMSWIHSKLCSRSCLTFKHFSPSSSQPCKPFWTQWRLRCCHSVIKDWDLMLLFLRHCLGGDAVLPWIWNKQGSEEKWRSVRVKTMKRMIYLWAVKTTKKNDLSVSSQNNEEKWPISEQLKQWREMIHMWAVKATKRNDPSVCSQSNKEKWPICEQSKQQRKVIYVWAVKTMKRNDPSVSSQNNEVTE